MEFDKNGEIETKTKEKYLEVSLNDQFVPVKGKRKTFPSYSQSRPS